MGSRGIKEAIRNETVHVVSDCWSVFFRFNDLFSLSSFFYDALGIFFFSLLSFRIISATVTIMRAVGYGLSHSNMFLCRARW